MASVSTRTLQPVPAEPQISKFQYEKIVQGLMRDLDYNDVPPIPDRSMEKMVKDRCLAAGFDERYAGYLAEHGVAAAQCFYPLHDRETQALIGLFTALCFSIDDLCDKYLDEVRSFRQNIAMNRPQVPPLQALADVLVAMDQHFDRFSSDRISTGLMDFMGACAIEYESTGRFKFMHESQGFALYFRLMTGFALPYTYFLFPKELFIPGSGTTAGSQEVFIQAVPDLLVVTGGINDLFFFYKESVVGEEENNYVHHLCLEQKVGIPSALQQLADDLKARIRKCRTILAAYPELLLVFDRYVQGQITFHVTQSRYRFAELNITLPRK